MYITRRIGGRPAVCCMHIVMVFSEVDNSTPDVNTWVKSSQPKQHKDRDNFAKKIDKSLGEFIFLASRKGTGPAIRYQTKY